MIYQNIKCYRIQKIEKSFVEIMYWIKKVNYSFRNDTEIENIYSFTVRTIDQYKRTRKKHIKQKKFITRKKKFYFSVLEKMKIKK